MNVEVLKYGGTSVATIAKIDEIARFIANKNSKVIVVVSAMNKETDELLQLAKEANCEGSSREIDMLLTTGEQKSASLMALTLQKYGKKAISLNAYQAKINVIGNYQNAKISDISKDILDSYFETNDVLVITGFQGINDKGDLSTLGRGGSDTSCICLAQLYNVPAQIFTDTTGIYTANPTVVKNAYQIDEINFDQMMEMAIKGSGVMEVRSIEIAKKNNIDIYVGLSPYGKNSTKITNKENDVETKVITGISENLDCVKVDIKFSSDEFSNHEQLLKKLSDEDFRIDFVKLSKNELSFTIDTNQKGCLENIISEFANVKQWTCDDSLSKVTVVGISLSSNVEILHRVASCAHNQNTKIIDLFTTDISISTLVDKKQCELFTNALANEFNLTR